MILALLPVLVIACARTEPGTDGADPKPDGELGVVADSAGTIRTAHDSIRKLPADTTAANDYGRPVVVEFADSVGKADVQWLKQEGFKILEVSKPGHHVVALLPPSYRGRPMEENRRIIDFSVMTVPAPYPDTLQSGE